ncbi:CcdC family protein [Paenibacillus xylaniclasticus]|uniref:CcdC family protein n=1 Tax=Paenibacillus xylaniclasticus TaxID=588083 RepID=UPI000FDCA72F|nr:MULTISPECIES: cytochrome c biogenesis protein CcdC [Paenibacillus]GFN32813.1 protein CcdC [Paenibacillus curdlanolyticus]
MQVSAQLVQYGSLFMSIVAGATIIAVRMKAANKPTSLRKIIMPPVGMSTGFLMFISPLTHVSLLWAIVALAAGVVLFAPPLIATSHFERVGDQIYLRRSRMFIYFIIGLFIIRIALHDVVERYVTVPQTGALFFLLAFGMLVPWRLAMLVRYRRLVEPDTISS